jgi:hypothetical protein
LKEYAPARLQKPSLTLCQFQAMVENQILTSGAALHRQQGTEMAGPRQTKTNGCTVGLAGVSTSHNTTRIENET